MSCGEVVVVGERERRGEGGEMKEGGGEQVDMNCGEVVVVGEKERRVGGREGERRRRRAG